MEQVNCNLCGANDAELVYIEKDRLLKLPGTFRLVRCRQCGLLYLNPRPAPQEIKDYYPEEYGPYTVTPQDEPSWITRLDQSYGYWKRARIVSRARPQGGRILDVGCAMGNFLHMMTRLGPWETYGLDIDEQATGYAQDRYRVCSFTGELTDAGYPDSYFDVVTMWDVMEHLHDPTAALAEVHRILKPDGLFLARVPNVATWDARLFGPYWVGYDAPRHLYIYSPATLTAFLHKTGFRVDRMRSLILGYPPFALSVQFWLEAKMDDGRLRDVLLALNNSRLPRVITRPVFNLLSYSNVTFASTVFASKSDAEVG